jgi:SAM-dependent methyltransferase
MPPLDTSLHLDMLRRSRTNPVVRRLKLAATALRSSEGPWEGYGGEATTVGERVTAAARLLFARKPLYGLEWGDPEALAVLRHVRDHFLLPYVTAESTVLEIGPGGGRWTRYLLGARRIYLIDYHQELLDELARSFRDPRLTMIRNHGSDFPGVPEGAVDFLFSFGCFVHLDLDIIEGYLDNVRGVLKPDGIAVLHYADKTKPGAQRKSSFSDNDPERMRAGITSRGFTIYEEDTTSISHSAIVRFGLAPADPA